MNTPKFAEAVSIRYEGTSSEIWVTFIDPETKARHFVARCKYMKPGTRAREIIQAIAKKFGPGVEGVRAYIAVLEGPLRPSPMEACGLTASYAALVA